MIEPLDSGELEYWKEHPHLPLISRMLATIQDRDVVIKNLLAQIARHQRTPRPRNGDAVRIVKLDLPFQSDTFQSAWEDFVVMRAEIGKTLRPTGIKLSLAKLALMGESDAIMSLKDSTSNQWQGLFEPKGNGNGNGTTAGSSRQRAANPGQSVGNEDDWASKFESTRSLTKVARQRSAG